MIKSILPIAIVCMSFLALPAVKAGNNATVPTSDTTNAISVAPVAAIDNEAAVESAGNLLYEELNLASMGLSHDAMKYAYKGHQKLVRKGIVPKGGILTVIDFSQSSRKKRMYILDLDSREVLVNTYVAHGKNSGLDYASQFSNVHESLQSSLGFYVTKGTYFGKHGLSLRLDGKDRGFNDNAESRAVVVHGAEYIGAHRKGSSYMGRSFGCPAVPQAESAKIINMIKNGTTMFIYHPSSTYLKGSKILND